MARDLPVAVASAITQPVVPLAFFAELQFASGTVRMWSGFGTKSWNGQNWSGAGDFGGLSPVDESTEVRAAGLAFTLSGIPSNSIALALGDSYRGRPCKLWMAILDDAEAIVGAHQIFAGRMDVMKIDDTGETATISVQAESRLVDLRRPRSLRYTDAEQQRLFAGDVGLEYVAKLAEKPLFWGVPAPGGTAPGYGGDDDMSSDSE
jgi:hypothetical protein